MIPSTCKAEAITNKMRDIKIKDILFLHILNEEFSILTFTHIKGLGVYLDSKNMYISYKSKLISRRDYYLIMEWFSWIICT